MTAPAGPMPWSPRGRIRADLIYLGWQPAAQRDPGPPPVPPCPAELDEVHPDWLAAQRREQARLTRSARLTLLACLVLALADVAGWLVSHAVLAVPAGAALAVITVLALWRIGQGRRALHARLRAEEQRVARFREVQRQGFAASQQRYARLHRDWQWRAAASWRRPPWLPVTLPASVHRVDLAGGTLAGWSALLTTMAVPRLAAGGEVTILDLTEGRVAASLIAVAGRAGVWVLPDDLDTLYLGAALSPPVLADVLALTAHDAAWPGNTAVDSALLAGIMAALADGVTMAKVLAALRVLGQIGGPDQQLGLSAGELARISALTGRGAERLVVDRAWAMESRLRVLSPLGSAPGAPHRQLNVACLDRRAAAVGNGTIAAYLTAALTATLRQAAPGPPWQHTVVLLGAERLPGEQLDRLCGAAEHAGAGLVLAYRSIPAPVRDRLGTDDSAVAFMRLGNADEAGFAAGQIGTEHRLVLSQLTQTTGTSVTDTSGDSYASNLSDSLTTADSVTTSDSRGSRDAPFGRASRDSSTGVSFSVTDGVTTGTSWGISTSTAIGGSDSVARTVQRSREFLVEQRALQLLPERAVVLCYDGRVQLLDANPADDDKIASCSSGKWTSSPRPPTSATRSRSFSTPTG